MATDVKQLFSIGDEVKIAKTLNLDTDKLNHYMILFSQWLASQGHLPQISNENCRKKFLVWAKLDFEKAKKKFIRYCYSPVTYKELIGDRVISMEGDLKAMNFICCTPMPTLTPEGYRVNVIQIVYPEKYESLAFARFFAMACDLRLYHDGLTAGEISIFDMAGFKPTHYAKVFDINLLKLAKLFLKHYPFTPKKIFILNCHPLLQKGIGLIKSVLPPKIADRVQITTPEDLSMYVPAECLPKEYGGTDESLDFFKGKVIKWIQELEDFLIEVAEAKPTGPVPGEFKTYEHEFGIDGSFRRLTID